MFLSVREIEMFVKKRCSRSIFFQFSPLLIIGRSYNQVFWIESSEKIGYQVMMTDLERKIGNIPWLGEFFMERSGWNPRIIENIVKKKEDGIWPNFLNDLGDSIKGSIHCFDEECYSIYPPGFEPRKKIVLI